MPLKRTLKEVAIETLTSWAGKKYRLCIFSRGDGGFFIWRQYSFLGVSISQPLGEVQLQLSLGSDSQIKSCFFSILFWTFRLTLTAVICRWHDRIGQLSDLLSLQHWLSWMMQDCFCCTKGAFSDRPLDAATVSQHIRASLMNFPRQSAVRGGETLFIYQDICSHPGSPPQFSDSWVDRLSCTFTDAVRITFHTTCALNKIWTVWIALVLFISCWAFCLITV